MVPLRSTAHHQSHVGKVIVPAAVAVAVPGVVEEHDVTGLGPGVGVGGEIAAVVAHHPMETCDAVAPVAMEVRAQVDAGGGIDRQHRAGAVVAVLGAADVQPVAPIRSCADRTRRCWRSLSGGRRWPAAAYRTSPVVQPLSIAAAPPVRVGARDQFTSTLPL